MSATLARFRPCREREYDLVIVHQDIDGAHELKSVNCWCMPDIIKVMPGGQDVAITNRSIH